MLVGPIPTGVNKFLFTADAIDPTQIPSTDVLGVSVILLTASYDDREFVRVGFYNNNEYIDTAQRETYDKLLAEGTDEEKAAWKFEGVKNVGIQRNILTAKPRVTRFNIKWDNENFNDEPPVQEEDDVGDVVELEQLGEGEGEGEDQEEEQDEEEGGGGDDVAADERPDVAMEDGDAGPENSGVAAPSNITTASGAGDGEDEDEDEEEEAEEEEEELEEEENGEDDEDLGSGSESEEEVEEDDEGGNRARTSTSA